MWSYDGFDYRGTAFRTPEQIANLMVELGALPDELPAPEYVTWEGPWEALWCALSTRAGLSRSTDRRYWTFWDTENKRYGMFPAMLDIQEKLPDLIRFEKKPAHQFPPKDQWREGEEWPTEQWEFSARIPSLRVRKAGIWPSLRGTWG